MFEGRHCRYLSDGRSLGQHMGTRGIEEFLDHMLLDASCPEDLDRLADAVIAQKRLVTHKESRARLKAAWRAVRAEADAARARLAANPSRTSHPGFFSDRSVGRPGMLDCDLFLPLVFRLDLTGFVGDRVHTGCYSAPLEHGRVHRLGATKSGEAWVEPLDGSAVKVAASTLRGLMNLGRLVALPLSAAPRAQRVAA